MAITGTDRGTGTHNTGANSFDLSPGSNFSSQNSWGVLVIAVDNADSGGAAHSTFTVTDTLGNTWIRRISPLYDPGAGNAGVEGAMFTCLQDKGLLTTSTVITVTFDTSTTAKVWTLNEVTPTAGFQLQYVTGGVNTGSATGSPTVTTGTITNGNMVIGGLFNERGTDQTVTGDSDTTNGSWSAQQTTEIGTTAAGMTVSSQRKVVTATATQTFNPTLGTSSDVILGWIELTEVAVQRQYAHLLQAAATVATVVLMAAGGMSEPEVEPVNHDALHAHRQITAAPQPQRLPFWPLAPIPQFSEEIQQPQHDLFALRAVTVLVDGHFLLPTLQVQLDERETARQPIDHAARFALFGRAPAAQPADGHFLTPQRQYRQRDQLSEPRPIDHAARFALFGRASTAQAPQRLPFWAQAPTRLEPSERIARPAHPLLPRVAPAAPAPRGHYLAPFLGVRLADKEWVPPPIDHAERFALMGRTAVAAPADGHYVVRHHAVRVLPLELVPRPIDHAARFALFHRTTAGSLDGTFVRRYTQVQIRQAPETFRTIDHARLFTQIRRPTAVVQQPQRLPILYAAPLPQLETLQVQRALDHARLFTLFGRTVAAAAPQRLAFWPVVSAQQAAEEEISQPKHDLFALRAVTVLTDGHFLTPQRQFRQRDQAVEPPAINHAARFALFGRTVVAAPAAPQRLWLWRQPTTDFGAESIRQPQHSSLHAFRGERVYYELIKTTDYGLLLQSLQPPAPTPVDHAARFFPHRQYAVVAVPQRLPFWPTAPIPRFAEEISQPKHDLFALRAVTVLTDGHVLVPQQQFRQRDPASEPRAIDHAARFAMYSRTVVAAPQQPQRLWFWKQPAADLTPEAIRPPQHASLHAFRGVRSWYELVAESDYSRLLETFAQPAPTPVDHAARFFPHRQFAPAAPQQPQRLYAWREPTRLEVVPEPPRAADHNVWQFYQQRFFNAFPTQRLWAWREPTQVEPIPDFRPPTHALFPFRQYAAVVAQPQRLPFQVVRPVLEEAGEQIRPAAPSLELFRLRVVVAAPQRLPFWPRGAGELTVAEELPRSLGHDLTPFRQAPVQPYGAQRLWLWGKAALPSEEAAPLAAPAHSLHAFRSTGWPYGIQRLWTWQPLPAPREEDEELRAPRHLLPSLITVTVELPNSRQTFQVGLYNAQQLISGALANSSQTMTVPLVNSTSILVS